MAEPPKIVLTEDLKRQAELDRQERERQAEEWASQGRCGQCGVLLVDNLNQGVIMCAGSHAAQYAQFLQMQEMRIHFERQQEQDRVWENMPRVKCVADIIEPWLSGQYMRHDALEIASEVIEALCRL